MGKRKRYWAYLWPMTNGFFALKRDFGAKEICFWHKVKSWECYYVFLPNETYHVDDDWTADRCRDLEDELRKANSSLTVVRFAASGKLFEKLPVPHNIPSPPKCASVPRKQHQQREQQLGALFTERVLFGRFDGTNKEYAWWLPISVYKREDVQPGEKVVVWAQGRRQFATVSRIEKYDGSVVPTARVIRRQSPLPKKSIRETARKKNTQQRRSSRKRRNYRRTSYVKR